MAYGISMWILMWTFRCTDRLNVLPHTSHSYLWMSTCAFKCLNFPQKSGTCFCAHDGYVAATVLTGSNFRHTMNTCMASLLCGLSCEPLDVQNDQTPCRTRYICIWGCSHTACNVYVAANRDICTVCLSCRLSCDSLKMHSYQMPCYTLNTCMALLQCGLSCESLNFHSY